MFAALLLASVASKPALIPYPNRVQFSGAMGAHLSASSAIQGADGMFAVTDLKAALKGVPGAGGRVRFAPDKDLKPEEYSLDVARGAVHINYGGPSGALYAVQTLKQMMNKGDLPTVAVDDSPRFEWRGMHLDVSRHFFTVADVERLLDLMKTYKMNVFHWHLVDDGGWRIEIKKYPRLTEVGSYRKGNGDWGQNGLELVPKGPNTYGGFYTQDQVREVIKYAAQRGITIVPEIEMPGHTLPAIIAYPEVGCTNAKPYAGVKWVTNVYCAGKEKTFEMIDNILDEVMALFPSKVIHIGGDEVDSKWWEGCPDCQARMKSEGLKGSDELQSYFIRRIEKYLNSRGRTLMGWDEILAGGLAPNAEVMSWRGIDGGIAAAKAGHPVVMTPTSHCYFDYGYDSIDTKKVYLWDPVPAALTPEQGKMVRGGQCNLWTEWIPTRDRLDTMIFPRGLAMAETLWSKGPKDWPGFEERLQAVLPSLDKAGVAYRMEAPESAIYFSSKPVVYKAPVGKPALFWSMDAKAPGTTWKPLTSMPLPANQTVYVAHRRANGSVGDAARLYVASVPPMRSMLVPPVGLKVFRWTGEFKNCADVEALPLRQPMDAKTVSLDSKPRPDTFALRFKGRIRFPDTHFKLILTCDDGAWLKLNGVTVIDNDGLHAPAAKEVTLDAEPRFYDLDVTYFDAGGGNALKLEYEGPDGKRREVPADWYHLPVGN